MHYVYRPPEHVWHVKSHDLHMFASGYVEVSHKEEITHSEVELLKNKDPEQVMQLVGKNPLQVLQLSWHVLHILASANVSPGQSLALTHLFKFESK